MKILIFFFFTFCFGSLLAQDCPSCDKYLDYIYDKISIQRSEDLSTSFSSWFFSSRFESEIKNNKAGLSITVPLEGIPVTFGGSYESARAWELREQNIGSTKWDFSKVTKSTIFTQIATDEARKVWLQCIEYSCSNRNEILPVSAITTQQEAIFTFSYNSNILEKQPTYDLFICGGGLDCSQANKAYRKKLLKKQGEAIKFKWINDEATEGTVILNTSSGSTRPILVSRYSKPNKGTLTYLKDSDGPEKLIGHSTSPSTVSIGFTNETNCHGGCATCSPDGKYCATLTKIDYPAGPGQIFRNPKPRCDEAHAVQCPWTDCVKIEPGDGSGVSATIRNWGSGSAWVIDVDVYAKTTIQKVETVPIAIEGKDLTVTVPKTSVFPLVTLQYKNKNILFRPDALISDDVTLQNVTSDEASTIYNFRLK